jgi:hypothetical protein
MLPNKASGGIKFYCFTYLTNRLINSIYDTRSELYIIIPPRKGNIAYNNSLLMLKDIYLYKCVTTTYRYLFHSDELILSQLLLLTDGNRHPNTLSVLYCKTTLRKRSFVLSSIDIWNKLPIRLRSIRSFVSLEHLYKNYLINTYVD